MTKEYQVDGMTCQSCVDTVREALQGFGSSEVQLSAPQVRLHTDDPVPLADLQARLGHYKITPWRKHVHDGSSAREVTAATYRPLILLVGFLLGVAFLVQYPFESFSWRVFLRHFMAGFFLSFSFFKLLDLRGFADSYARYDLAAARWHTWGYIYPFLELGLGISYLIGYAPTYTNLVTIALLGFSSIGVTLSNLRRQNIQCACLGAVFDLPMSTVTIIEDVGMVLMALMMLLW